MSKQKFHYEAPLTVTATLTFCHASFWNSKYFHALKIFVSCARARVSPGTLVPRATKAMALTLSFKKMKHPKCPAMSPIRAVLAPIIKMLTTKVGYPSIIAGNDKILHCCPVKIL